MDVKVAAKTIATDTRKKAPQIYLQRLDALERVEGTVGQRLNVVIVERQQAQIMQILESIPSHATDFVRVQQQQLE